MSESLRKIIPDCFERQRGLMRIYKDLEQLPDAPISLHTPSGQKLIKDFAWRTVEELVEASDAWHDGPTSREAIENTGEELADAMHFFIELCIFAGVTAEQLLDVCDSIVSLAPVAANGRSDSHYFFAVIRSIGRATHHLRNRPWKQQYVPTDEAAFRQALTEAYKNLLVLWTLLGYTMDDLYAYYCKKNSLNLQRQQDGY